MTKSWQCPYCKAFSSIDEKNISSETMEFNNNNKYGSLRFCVETITCPNPDCREFTVDACINKVMWTISTSQLGEKIFTWKLKPNSMAKALPEYIPQAIKEDYEEACSIVNLSPKSSATLARRCLQGMIRDFWKVKPKRLIEEIEAIKGKVDPLVWDSIEVIRKVGNIGAHMESDINLIVDVEPHEAELLINLIETLIEEWYINRHEREQRLQSIKALGQSKEDEKLKLKQANNLSS